MDCGELEVHVSETASEDDISVVGRIMANGVHKLRPGRFMRVHAREVRLSTVCTFVSR
jgi:hypothetical protein